MLATLIISISVFVLIIVTTIVFPKIKIGKISISTYWIVALLGAAALLIFGLSPIKEVGNQLVSNTAINPLKILVLFFSMTLISIFLDEFGLFRYLAGVASKRANNNQIVLFITIYLLTSALTVFTSNDVVILTLTPFICFFAKNAKIKALPYLIAEFVAANTWSMIFIIGNPTNIYLATSAHINFINYFKVMAIPTLLAGTVELILLFLLFRKELKKPLETSNEEYKIENKALVINGVIHLLTCLVFLVISSYINVEMWIVSGITASTLIVSTLIITLINKGSFKTFGTSFRRLPYELIPFFLSMFVIVVAFNYQGISLKIAEFLGENHVIWVYGYTSFLASNLINNIPMSIMYSNILTNVSSSNYLGATFASIIGSNLGAFLTPFGALAGIMFTSLTNKYKVKFNFLDFIKYGSILSIPTITVALATLCFSIYFI